MNKARAAVFGLALAVLPLTIVHAAQDRDAIPAGAQVVYDFFGRPVGYLTPIQPGQAISPASAPPVPALVAGSFADPAAIFSRQIAMMRRIEAAMDAQMRALVPAFAAAQDRPIDIGLRGSAVSGLPAPGQGAAQLVVTHFVSNGGSRSQTVTYSYDGSKAQPRVAVRTVGDACGDSRVQPGRSLPVAAPNDTQTAPAAPPPPSSRLIQVDYRHPAGHSRPISG